MKRRLCITLVTGAALGMSACGGGGPIDDNLEDAQGRPGVAIVSQGPNAISTWGGIAFKTAGNAAGHDLVTTHLAMYDAVMAVARTHKPYAITPATSGAGIGAVGMNAAAVEAAYRVLKGLFPAGGANYEAQYTADMAALPAGDAKTRGQAIGAEVAAGMLTLRANDGRATVLAPYVPGTLPGQFHGVNPVGRVLPYVKPFATLSHSQFRAPWPLALTSEAYAADVNEVKAIASTTSTTRTPAQTELARFETENPSLYWDRNLRQFVTASSDLAENARLAAMLWTVFQDAGSACFETKYHYNFWRPISAIQLADTDGNAATEADPAWTPHVTTPNHPEYPAAHGCITGSLMETVRSYYGTKNVAFTFSSSVSGTGPRSYARTDDKIKEVMGRARLGRHALPHLGRARCRTRQERCEVGHQAPLPTRQLTKKGQLTMSISRTALAAALLLGVAGCATESAGPVAQPVRIVDRGANAGR